MTKTDFAELKEKLCEFDSYEVKKYILNYVDMGAFSKPAEALPYLTDGALIASAYQHTKSSAIISELIEIIQSQSEALEHYSCSYQQVVLTGCELAQQTFSETTTRLQKLRDGNNGK